MHPSVLAVSAAALALERLAYAIIWRRPDLFARASRFVAPAQPPVDVLAWTFAAFKVIQIAVFLGWCIAHGDGLSRASEDAGPLVVGGLLVVTGQVLNLSVFARLGRTGVLYGNRFGYEVPWCRGFPFSIVRHPQYVGTVLSIWGFFIVLRYPAPDWAVLPLLETVYYVLGALAEQAPIEGTVTPEMEPAATTAGPSGSPRLP